MEQILPSRCLNCDNLMHHIHCGHCGQKKTERLSFKQLIKIIQSGIFEFKSPFLITMWGLTVNPGKVCREYIEGRRKTYFNPARYVFWLLTLSLFVSAIFDTPILSEELWRKATPSIDNDTMRDNLTYIVEHSYIYLSFVYALFSAAFLKLFFSKEKYSFAEYYIVSILSSAHVMLLAVVLIITGSYDSVFGQTFYGAAWLIYSLVTLASFFQKNYVLTVIKALIAFFLCFISFSLIAGIAFAFFAGIKTGLEAPDIDTATAITAPKNSSKEQQLDKQQP